MFSSRLFRDPFFSPMSSSLLLRSPFDLLVDDDVQMMDAMINRQPMISNRRSSARTNVFDRDPFFTRPARSVRVDSSSQEEQKNDEPAAAQTAAAPSAAGQQQQTQTSTQTAESTQPKTAPTTGQQQGLLSHPRSYSGWLGGGLDPMHAMVNRVNRLLNAAQQEDWPMDSNTSDMTTYSCSSSSFTETGADGKPIVSSHHRTERRRMGDVTEEHESFKDHLGNERVTTKRGIAKQVREVITERNGSGAERKTENLHGIRPEEVDKFDAAWRDAAQKHDPKHSFLIKDSQQQPQQQQTLTQQQEQQPASLLPAKEDLSVKAPASQQESATEEDRASSGTHEKEQSIRA
jgi:hypothetical protein